MQHTEEKRFEEPFPVASGEVPSIGVRVRQRLWEQMARECEAMVQHALSSGRAIPPEVVEQLDRALSGTDSPVSLATSGRPSIGELPREGAICGEVPAPATSRVACLS